jgi:8-hydroxy-5-deazaflavin:NADPH oxidoreductase
MGNAGSALGRSWAEAGHQVTFCVRDPNDARKRAEAGKAKAALGPLGDAAKAESVLLAVPWSAVRDALKAARDLSGKVLLDCTNPVTPELTHLTIGHSTSAGEEVARLAPQARVVKIFNTNGAMNMAHPDYGCHKVTMLYAGDDEGANRVAAGLAEQIGFEPLYLGPLKEARLLEPLAWPGSSSRDIVVSASTSPLTSSVAQDPNFTALLTPSTRRRNMADTEWGKCKDCKWFQIEPDAQAANNTMGLCIEEDLQRFGLRVSGNCGSKVAHAEGSSCAPPVATATR